MKVLVVGGGGREHALAWKLAQSPKLQAVYVAPGNGGTALDSRLENIPITDVKALREWALEQKIALTVVGPEQPLAAGIVDDFRAHGLRVFGPTKAAAQLESSKAFSKAFMKRHGIPTAEYETFSDAVAAHAYVDEKGAPIVVKADGVTVSDTLYSAKLTASGTVVQLDGVTGDVVRVEYTCGLPAGLLPVAKQAVLLMVGQYYVEREGGQADRRAIDWHIDALRLVRV